MPTPTRIYAAVALLTLACSAHGQRMSDEQVVAAVEKELMRDDAVPYDRIEVRCRDGVVTLSGSVETLATRVHAERRAAVVRGVRSVLNQIKVATDPPLPGDAVGDIETPLRS